MASSSSVSNLDRLVELARQGRQEALAQLLDASRNYLMLLARIQLDRRLQGKVAPSDVVQETFLEACRAFPRFSGSTEQDWLAWLRRILVFRLTQTARRFLKARRRDVQMERQWQQEVDRSSARIEAMAGSFTTPSQKAIRREQAVLLADILSQLPWQYREVIILRHLQQLTFPEVAARLGQSEASVKKTWARALAAVRRALGGLSDERI